LTAFSACSTDNTVPAPSNNSGRDEEINRMASSAAFVRKVISAHGRLPKKRFRQFEAVSRVVDLHNRDDSQSTKLLNDVHITDSQVKDRVRDKTRLNTLEEESVLPNFGDADADLWIGHCNSYLGKN
jgi:hypothetical protein